MDDDYLEALVCCNPGHCSIHTSRQNTARLPPCMSQNKGQLCPCCSCRLTAATSRITPNKESAVDFADLYERRIPSSKEMAGDTQRQSQVKSFKKQ